MTIWLGSAMASLVITKNTKPKDNFVYEPYQYETTVQRRPKDHFVYEPWNVICH